MMIRSWGLSSTLSAISVLRCRLWCLKFEDLRDQTLTTRWRRTHTIVAAATLPESLLTSRKRARTREKYSIFSTICGLRRIVKNSFLSLFFRCLEEFEVWDSGFVRGLVPRCLGNPA